MSGFDPLSPDVALTGMADINNVRSEGLLGSRHSYDSCGFLNAIPQVSQRSFSFRLSTLGREPGATSAQVTRMRLDSVPEAQVHNLQTSSAEQALATQSLSG